MDAWRGRGVAVAVVIAAWAGLYLPALGALELKGEEGRRVLPAITMLETGRWIVPEVGGADYFNKPPMVNWMVAASFAVTGSRAEWAARLPSVLSVLAFALLLVALPCRWLGLRARLLAAIVFLTNVSMVSKGRLIEIEAAYVSLTGIATWWWLAHFGDGASRWRQWLPVAFVLAVGALLKGPFIGLFFYAVVLCVLRRQRGLRELFSREHLSCVGLAGALVLVWVALAHLDASGAVMRQRWQAELGERLLFSSTNLANWGWSILKTLRNFLPWVVFLPLLWRRSWIERLPEEHRTRFVALRDAMVVGFVVMNLMPGTLARYSLPVFPLASLLVGWMLSTSTTALPSDRAAQTIMTVLGVGLVVFAGTCVVLGGAEPIGVSILIATVVGVSCLVRFRNRVRGPVTVSVVGTAITVGTIVVAAHSVIPFVRSWEKLRPAGEAVTRLVPDGRTVHVYDPGYASFLYYVRAPIEYVLRPSGIDDDVQYLLVGERRLATLQANPTFRDRAPRLVHRLSDRIAGDFRLYELQPRTITLARHP